MVDSFLTRMEQHREFRTKAMEYLPADAIGLDDQIGGRKAPDFFPHRGVHYWEGKKIKNYQENSRNFQKIPKKSIYFSRIFSFFF